MRAAVFNDIECDYNRWRRHRALSPEQFESKNLAQERVYITRRGSDIIPRHECVPLKLPLRWLRMTRPIHETRRLMRVNDFVYIPLSS